MIPLSHPNWETTDWKKILAAAIRDPRQLLIRLGLEQLLAHESLQSHHSFRTLVPQPFVAKMAFGDPADPLLRQVLPLDQELVQTEGYSLDPLQEQDSAIPGLLHKYQSRVLLIGAAACAVNCRYCFRRHFPYHDHQPGKQNWDAALDYVAAHGEINEIILSGGDPLLMGDEVIAAFMQRAARLPHVKRVRIHSRLPVVIPQRLTENLLASLSESPLRVVLVMHMNHANEMDAALKSRLLMAHQAGITLLNQSVLLAGVNDDANALAALSETLFEARVQPYYLHQLDRVQGTAHFEVTDDKARAIMAELLNRLPGFLVPTLARELPGYGSKIPVDLRLA